MLYIGIDNGISGSIAAVTASGCCIHFANVPVKMDLGYTKKVRNVTRIDVKLLRVFLVGLRNTDPEMRIIMERPMINPGRFQATVSAIRAMEATLIALESLALPSPTRWVDSREWQKIMLPKGVTGEDLKTASLTIGCRLFPAASSAINKHKDADGLLIAEWARRMQI